MSDFIGYARSNLFKVKDITAFTAVLDKLALPISHLSHPDLAGFIWTGADLPFTGFDMADLAKAVKGHIEESIIITVAGSERGAAPMFELIEIDTKGRVTVQNLPSLLRGRDINFHDAPVLWAA